MVLTTEEKVFIVEHYFRSYGNGRDNGLSLKQVSEKYRQEFNKVATSKSVMLAIVEKFRHTHSVLCQCKGSSGRRRTVFTNNNQGRVLDHVIQFPKRSLRRTAYKLNISETYTRRLFKSVGGYPCRIQIAQRTNVQEKFTVDEYESHIHLNGYINRQTTRILGFERPDVIVEKPLHSERATIWCAVSEHGIIGPYFVEDEDKHLVTINQQRYKENIITPFVRDLRNFCRERNLPVHRQ
ncbi:hypothetical protein ILUMI_02031 [Ignelater luminosus]|uniref:DUF4817 domain-containing protein n=1 Tax=Ignelater luminosus TaxID=2038154 RepID=A0A8K0DIG6_IGNLU|nr:hypothetical protein ILUMI_02031 [Ignelater luminosus]